MNRYILAAALATSCLLSAPALAQKVRLTTAMGDIVLQLDAEKAPKTVANFVQYVKAGQYDGTVFHRVIDGFMIQGGGMDKNLKEKATRAPIDNEAGEGARGGLKNVVGTLAMARTTSPHSATAQFFINVSDNDPLNFREPTPQGYGYAVFGRVIKGMDIVQRIAKTATTTAGQFENVPRSAITINSVKIIPQK